MARDARMDNLGWLMDLPVQGDPPGGVVWHYTDLGGLLGILSTNTLWASASSLLNDTEEMRHGREKVREALAKASGGMSPDQRAFVEAKLDLAEKEILGGLTFVLCASTNGDSLSQWRGYSGGASGYAVGLKTSDRLDLLEVDAAPEAGPGESQFVSPWRTVLYGRGKKHALAKQLVDRLTGLAVPPTDDFWNDALVTAYAPPAYGAAISRMKHDGFQDEHEVRMVATAMAADRFYHFRAGPYGPTPYVKLTGVPKPTSITGRSEYSQAKASKLPIQAVRIGPGPHVDAAEEGLRSALVRYGYGSVKIKRSSLPFR